MFKSPTGWLVALHGGNKMTFWHFVISVPSQPACSHAAEKKSQLSPGICPDGLTFWSPRLLSRGVMSIERGSYCSPSLSRVTVLRKSVTFCIIILHHFFAPFRAKKPLFQAIGEQILRRLPPLPSLSPRERSETPRNGAENCFKNRRRVTGE